MKPTSSLPKHVQKIVLSGGVPKICTLCDGTRGRDEGMGWFTCPHCEGTGYEPESSGETPTPQTNGLSAQTGDVIRAARVMCEQYQLLFSIVSDISGFKDVDWEQDDHEKAIRDFSRALAKLDVPLISTPSSQPQVTKEKEEQSGWIRTAVRPPTKEDGDRDGEVLAFVNEGSKALMIQWDRVVNNVYSLPFWMPIPKIT